MAKKNSMKKRQSRVVDAMRREQKQMEKQKLRERELKERFEERERKVSIGAQQRERRKNLKDASLKTTLLETKGGVLKKKKRRERKNQNKIVKGVRVGNATKIKKNVAYKGIVIKDAASKQAVLDMLKAEDRMM